MSYLDRLSRYTPTPVQIVKGDFYVSPCGCDAADGSEEHPFATFERAIEAVRALDKTGRKGITVCVHAGDYRTAGLKLTEEDSGSETCPIVYRAYGDGEVVLNGGVTLKSEDFEPLSEDIKARLHGEAQNKTMQIDLTRYGLTKADWGELAPIGAFGTETKYDSYQPDMNCEVFVNGKRMILARYPNADEFLRMSAVASVGDCFEFPEQNYHFDWHERRNHDGGILIMDKETTARAANWKSPKIWAYGYFYHDWADSSTPIKGFDLEHRTMYPEYVSRYGTKKDAQYYFYNILEELDEPGEWYLDRESGMLYLYSPVPIEEARVEMTVTRENIIHAENLSHVTFEGFTIKGTRNDAVNVQGRNCTLKNLTIYGVLGNAVVCDGYDNLVTECEISHTGKGGVLLSGGDFDTLTPGRNRVDNNLIHDWAEVFMVYCTGVRLDGVGNICSHNEFHDAPHAAIFYYGNDHVVEYNHIYNMVMHSSDAGAIYSGQEWAHQGCIVRYNCLHGIGSEGFNPDGIYFDDMLSGQQAYGNLLVDVRKNGFLIGGGRSNMVYNNIIVNAASHAGKPITYDDRGRDGFVNNGWAKKSVNDYEKGMMWVRLRRWPIHSDIWKERFPELSRISSDFAHPDDPDFAVNPSYAQVHDNLIIDKDKRVGRFDPSVLVYSDVHDNFSYESEEAAGLIPGEYILKDDAQALKDMPAFKNIPLEKIGRY